MSQYRFQIITLVISVLSPFIVVGLGMMVYTWQQKRSTRSDVYKDVIPAMYEAEFSLAVRISHILGTGNLSIDERKEVLKTYTSLLGRIGKLHAVVPPKAMVYVNELSDVLWQIYDGVVPIDDKNAHVFTEMSHADIQSLIDRFYRARAALLIFMRKSLGYRVMHLQGYKIKPVQIVLSSFIQSFLNETSKKDKRNDANRKPAIVDFPA